MEKMSVEQLNLDAMQIILHAGDARVILEEAFAALVKKDKTLFDEKIADVDKKIVDAHKIQTKCLQSQMEYEENVYSILLTHAQDTIMTVKSEYEMMKKMAILYLGENYEG